MILVLLRVYILLKHVPNLNDSLNLSLQTDIVTQTYDRINMTKQRAKKVITDVNKRDK
jgi:hypothetical protein